MTKEEVRFQVAVSCIQGLIETKLGIIGEVAPEVAVKESLRIADEFVKQWFGEHPKEQKAQKPVECHKDTLLEWAKLVLKCQEEELAKYDGPSYMKASTMGRIDAYKVLIAKLNSL